MFLPTLASLLALAAFSSASAVVPRAADPHQADFRTFGEPGCTEDNQGVYTLLKSDIGMCGHFTIPIGSLEVNNNLCTLVVYSDDDCVLDKKEIPVGKCASGKWQSFRLVC